MKVFISHSSNDKKFVRLLKSCLQENDIDTWLDEDELNLGDSLLKKLEKALDESSHFVIVLSKASVNSDWVQLELKKVISNQKSGLINKIIPVKYRACDIPEVLKELLYADLTNEIVLPDGEKVKFIYDGFEPFFLKLIKGIKSPMNLINEKEKEEIKKSLSNKKEEFKLNDQELIIRGTYLLDGLDFVEDSYNTGRILSTNRNDIDLENIYPIILPASLKDKWNLKLGDHIEVIGPDFKSSTVANFADFRNDDLKIIANKNTRHHAKIMMENYYNVEFNISENKISFIEKIVSK